MSRTKWLVYTVLLGLIPLLSRLLVAALSTRNVNFVSASDLVSFGIALSIANISNIENAPALDSDWKTRSVGLSLLAALLLGVVLVISFLAESASADFNARNLLIASTGLTVACVAHSYSVLDRLIKSHGAAP